MVGVWSSLWGCLGLDLNVQLCDGVFDCIVVVMDAYILPYFSVFYMDLFGEGLVLESLSIDVIRWSVTCCHHMHS